MYDTCNPYLFLHIYDFFSFPCLEVTFVFCQCLWSFYSNHKHFNLKLYTCLSIHGNNAHDISCESWIFTFGSHIIFHYDHLCISCLADIFVFCHLLQYHLNLYTCVSIHNANSYEAFSKNQIFYIWQPCYVFFVWLTY